MMIAKADERWAFSGSKGTLPINEDDEVALKLAMIIEGQCESGTVKETAKKFGYCKQRYYQLLNIFRRHGAAGLKEGTPGPKQNYVRTDNSVREVIRHRFLDPDASPAVIAQKMKQTGVKISARSVERVITEFGLQKKTLPVRSRPPA